MDDTVLAELAEQVLVTTENPAALAAARSTGMTRPLLVNPHIDLSTWTRMVAAASPEDQALAGTHPMPAERVDWVLQNSPAGPLLNWVAKVHASIRQLSSPRLLELASQRTSTLTHTYSRLISPAALADREIRELPALLRWVRLMDPDPQTQLSSSEAAACLRELLAGFDISAGTFLHVVLELRTELVAAAEEQLLWAPESGLAADLRASTYFGTLSEKAQRHCWGLEPGIDQVPVQFPLPVGTRPQVAERLLLHCPSGSSAEVAITDYLARCDRVDPITDPRSASLGQLETFSNELSAAKTTWLALLENPNTLPDTVQTCQRMLDDRSWPNEWLHRRVATKLSDLTGSDLSGRFRDEDEKRGLTWEPAYKVDEEDAAQAGACTLNTLSEHCDGAHIAARVHHRLGDDQAAWEAWLDLAQAAVPDPEMTLDGTLDAAYATL